MPSNTRRARERAGTRDRIVEAALTVLENEGAAALTIRRIAADVEYTAPIVYQHFAGKDALVRELVGHGYRLMMADLSRLPDEPDMDRRVLRIARAYVRFATEHPHLYQAMNDATVGADARRQAAAPAIGLVQELLTDWSRAHGVALAAPDEACEIVWGALYGIASLGSLDSLSPDRTERLAEQALTAILQGWRTPAA
ncbi:TetR family transcriptional regulator [Paractinoplanes abujensis]|uniref:AcrR family transcriptional regulator n=1 Tax=Paractinoplanes abujensis TaxID=882441 RepID=A0A7W7G204_9ACTN|nr:TetR/AcrR family transcriptional regulator [Actinoplanes abujensis]MBB4693204.1 AcrR family transcriptional regulator [Actinoplanes abujensis]GID24403.1 TetR family transcriptional regulator [Actinoplanes abujensis]